MSILHAIALASPLIASAAWFGLVRALRYLLRVPAATARTDDESADSASTDPWERITVHWSRWITRLLPAPIGLCAIALVAWFLAYLGWGMAWVSNRPMALAGLPPWFAGGRMLVPDAVWGVLVGILLSGIVGLLWFVGHAIGKCLIWPEACEEPGEGRR